MPDRPRLIRHPYVFITLTTIGLILLLGLAGTAIFLTGAPLDSPVPLVFTPLAVAIVVWATVTHRWRALGFQLPRADATRYPPTVTLLVTALALAAILVLTAITTGGMASVTLSEWVGIVGLVFLVAFVEETLFRSIFVSILRPRGVGRAIVTSSLAFSAAHSVNVLTGQDLATTGRQLLFALAFGLAASTIFLSTGTIWITIALHILFNYLQLSGTTQTPATADWIIIAILLALAGWLWSGLSPRRSTQLGLSYVHGGHS